MKGYNGLSILCVVLLLGMVLVSPTFAERRAPANDKKINEAELAQLNFSMSATSVKRQIVVIEKNDDDSLIAQEKQIENLKNDIASSPPVVKTKTEPISQERNINGQKFLFFLGDSNTFAKEIENLKNDIASSPPEAKITTKPISQERNINGQKFLFFLGDSTTFASGAITSVKPR